MNDGQSNPIGITNLKKIAKLTYLIGHLSSQMSEHNYQIQKISQSYQDSLDLISNDYNNKIMNFNNAISIPNYISSSWYNDFVEKITQFKKEYELFFAQQKSVMKEKFHSYQKIASQLLKKSQNCLDQINEEMSDFSQTTSMELSNLTDSIDAMEKRHQDEILSLENSQNQKFRKLQILSEEQINKVSGDYNRSISNMYTKFSTHSSGENMNVLYVYRKNLEEMKYILNNTKQSFQDFYQIINHSISQLQTKKRTLVQNLKNMSNQQKIEENQIKSQYENEENYEQQLTFSEIDDTLNLLKEQQIQMKKTNDVQLNEMAKSFEFQQQTFHKEIELLETENKKKLQKVISEIYLEEKAINESNDHTQNLINENQTNNINEINELQNSLQVLHKNFELEKDKFEEIKKNEVTNLSIKYQAAMDKMRNDNELINNSEIKTEENNLKETLNILKREKNEIENNFYISINSIENDFQEKLHQTLSSFQKEKEDLDKENHNKYIVAQNIESDKLQVQGETNEKEESFILQRRNGEDLNNDLNYNDFLIEKERIEKYYKEKEKELLDTLNSFEDTDKKDTIFPNIIAQEEEINQVHELKLKKQKEIEIKKTEIIDQFKNLQMKEEERHQFEMARFKLQPDLSIPNDNENDIKKTHIKQLREEIASLSFELSQLKEDFEKIIKEQKINSMKDIISPEKMMKEQQLKDISIESATKIKQAEEKSKNEINQIKRTIERYKNEFTSLKNSLLQNRKHYDDMVQHEKNQLDFSIKELENRHTYTKKELEKSYNGMKNALIQIAQIQNDSEKDPEMQQLKRELMDQYSKLENNQKEKTEKQHSKFNKIIEELNKLEEEALQKCNQAKKLFEERKRRPQDEMLLNNLGKKANLYSQHLSELMNDLTVYKKQLISQENIYQSHFGESPTVGVCRPMTASMSSSNPQRCSGRSSRLSTSTGSRRPKTSATMTRPFTSGMANRKAIPNIML